MEAPHPALYSFGTAWGTFQDRLETHFCFRHRHGARTEDGCTLRNHGNGVKGNDGEPRPQVMPAVKIVHGTRTALLGLLSVVILVASQGRNPRSPWREQS